MAAEARRKLEERAAETMRLTLAAADLRHELETLRRDRERLVQEKEKTAKEQEKRRQVLQELDQQS